MHKDKRNCAKDKRSGDENERRGAKYQERGDRRKMSGTLPAAAALMAGLAASGALSSGAVQAATQSLTETQALAVVQKDFSIPAYYTLTQQNYNSSQGPGNPASYSFTYTYKSPANQYQNVSVSIDAQSGAVLNYSSWQGQTPFTYPVSVSETQAQKIAVQWAKKLYPTQYPSTQMHMVANQQGPLTQALTYQFNFERYVNGIAAPFDGFSMTIDENGYLTSVQDTWSNGLSFPAPGQAISLTQANADYQKNLGLRLAYTTEWQTVTSNVYLSYTQSTGGIYPQWWNNQYGASAQNTIGLPVLDALTGQPVDATGAVHPLPAFQRPAALVPGGPTQAAGSVKVNWTRAQSLRYAESALGITSADRLTGSSESQNMPNGDVQWSFNWKGPNGEQLNASVDATLGVLQNYGEYTLNSGKFVQPNGGESTKISQSQATAAADAFVKALFPHDTGGLAVVADPYRPYGGQVQTSFEIRQLIHGLPLQGATGNVTVDSQTGKVQNFYWQSTPLSAAIPSPSAAIPMAQAEAVWMKAQPLTLQYGLTQPQIGQKLQLISHTAKESTAPAHVLLLYTPNGLPYGATLNAATGAFIGNQQGQQAYSGAIHGLGGVQEAPEITLLVRHGLLQVSPTGAINPTQQMTRAAFVTLVVNALGMNNGGPLPLAAKQAMQGIATGSPAYSAIRSAFANGWLSAGHLFHPNQPITRTEAAQIMVRALGYRALLSHSQIFSLPAKDAASIPQDQLVGDAVAYALNLLPLQNNNFNGSGTVSLARAAAAVVQVASDYSSGRPLFYQGGGMGAAGAP